MEKPPSNFISIPQIRGVTRRAVPNNVTYTILAEVKAIIFQWKQVKSLFILPIKEPVVECNGVLSIIFV
jgi:hypothetical protein